MKNSWKTLCLAALVSAGCLVAATEAAAHSKKNRYERRRGEHYSATRYGRQRQHGRRGYERNSYSRGRRGSEGVWAPGIPPHQVDMDSDGIPNIRDRDQDGDGVPNHRDSFPRDERRR